MNRLKNQNNFEQKLKDQFDNFEAKPNEGLWDIIAQNLQEDGFEKEIAGKLNSLEATPNKSVWIAIEKKLPYIITQTNRKLIYLWTSIVLLFGLFLGYLTSQYVQKNSATNSALSHPEAFVWLESKKITASNENPFTANDANAILKENETIPSDEKTIANVQNKPDYKQENSNKTAPPTHLMTQGAGYDKSTASKTETNVLGNSNNEPLIVANTKLDNKETVSKENSAVNQLNNNKTNSAKDPIVNLSAPTSDLRDSVIASKTNIDSSAVASIAIQKPDSIANDKSIVNAKTDQASENDYTGASLKRERLTILAFAGLAFGNMRYAEGNNSTNAAANINLREKTERSASDINGGFLIGYDLTKRFTISSGVILANFKQTLSYGTATPKNVYQGKGGENFQHVTDTIVTGNTYTAELKYSYTEIPLFITYKIFENKNFEASLQSGIGLGIITGVNTYIISTDNIGIYEVNKPDDFPTIRNTLFFTFQPQILYNIPSSIGSAIGIMPTVKTSFTNIIGDENWLKQYPYSFGLNIFLRKRF